jgi:antitoxin component of RelBE/YafQ-DinJ toxin-antitoxin module
MARNEQIHVAVRSDIKEKFAKIANGYGMTMSALASYIIGQYVYNHSSKNNIENKQYKDQTEQTNRERSESFVCGVR